MIEVKIVLHKGGVLGETKTIGSAWIVNDGTGEKRSGNYDIQIMGKTRRSLKEVRIEGFARQSYTAWKLLYLALGELFDKGGQ